MNEATKTANSRAVAEELYLQYKKFKEDNPGGNTQALYGTLMDGLCSCVDKNKVMLNFGLFQRRDQAKQDALNGFNESFIFNTTRQGNTFTTEASNLLIPPGSNIQQVILRGAKGTYADLPIDLYFYLRDTEWANGEVVCWQYQTIDSTYGLTIFND